MTVKQSNRLKGLAILLILGFILILIIADKNKQQNTEIPVLIGTNINIFLNGEIQDLNELKVLQYGNNFYIPVKFSDTFLNYEITSDNQNIYLNSKEEEIDTPNKNKTSLYGKIENLELKSTAGKTITNEIFLNSEHTILSMLDIETETGIAQLNDLIDISNEENIQVVIIVSSIGTFENKSVFNFKQLHELVKDKSTNNIIFTYANEYNIEAFNEVDKIGSLIANEHGDIEYPTHKGRFYKEDITSILKILQN